MCVCGRGNVEQGAREFFLTFFPGGGREILGEILEVLGVRKSCEGGGGGCNGCLNPTGMRKNMLPPSDEVKSGGKHPSVDHNCDFISAFGI